MNNDQFTPGPWVVCLNSEDNRLSIEQDLHNLSNEYGDPTIIVDYVGDMGQNLDRQTGEANARLIASAPELLNDLRRAVGALNHLPRHIVPQGCTHALACELETLIDKATNSQ